MLESGTLRFTMNAAYEYGRTSVVVIGVERGEIG